MAKRKTKKRKAVKKKTVRRKATKKKVAKNPKKKQSSYNRHVSSEMKKGKSMSEAAKSWKKKSKKSKTSKKGVKKVAKKKGRKRTYKRKRRRRSGNPGNPGGKLKIQDILMRAALGAAGGIGGSLIAQKVPVKDPRIKAAIPLIAAVGLSMTPLMKQKMMQPLVIGLATVGTMSLIRQFVPNIPLLAGEDEVYLPEYEQDLLGYDEDDLDALIEGEDDLEDIEEDIESMGVSEEFEGDSVDVMGQDDVWITNAD